MVHFWEKCDFVDFMAKNINLIGAEIVRPVMMALYSFLAFARASNSSLILTKISFSYVPFSSGFSKFSPTTGNWLKIHLCHQGSIT